MNIYKAWKMAVIVGGVIGLCMIPVLDVLIYFNVSRYSQNPAELILMLERFALIGLIVKYWLVVVGIVALVGWFLKIDGLEYKKSHKQD